MQRDAQLWLQWAQRHDTAALGEVLDLHSRAMMAYAVSFCRNHHTAEDALQETFIKACRAKTTYDGERPLRTWLIQILKNVLLDFRKIRQHRLARFGKIDKIPHPPTDPRDDPAEKICATEMAGRITQEMALLPKAIRHATEGRHLHGRTQRDLAQEAGVAIGTMKTRIHAGTHRVAKQIEAEKYV